MPRYLILLDMITLNVFGEEKITNYEAPHYETLSIFVLLPFSWVQTFPSAAVRDQVSNPCKVTRKLLVKYTNKDKVGPVL
jgi:hypothetical protein